MQLLIYLCRNNNLKIKWGKREKWNGNIFEFMSFLFLKISFQKRDSRQCNFFSFANSKIKTQVSIILLMIRIINIKHFIYDKHYSEGLIYVHSCKYSISTRRVQLLSLFYKGGDRSTQVNLSELTQLSAEPRPAPHLWLQSPRPQLLPSVLRYSHTPLSPDRNLESGDGQYNRNAEDRTLTLDFHPTKPTSRHSSVGKESACSAGELRSIPGSGRSPGEGNDNPLQYSYLGNPMDREAWWAKVHGVAKNWARLSD